MSTRYRTTETTTWREVDGEIVALELKDSVYYAVGGSGNVLWRRLAEGATRDELVDVITAEFDGVDPELVRVDVDEFLAGAIAQHLVEEETTQ